MVVAPHSRFRVGPDPVTIGLSMVNWLVLMLLLCGYLLATTTTTDGAAPAGSSAQVGSTAPR